jgi:hypothetical protein
VSEYTLHDGLKKHVITGKLLDRSSTERRAKLRWVELELYLGTENGTSDQAYFIHVIGQSVVYHLPGMDCTGGGVPLAPGQPLPADARPCPECQPPGKITPGTPVYLETTWYSLHRCATAPMVISRLTSEGWLSKPAEILLRRAAVHDAEISAALQEYAGEP